MLLPEILYDACRSLRQKLLIAELLLTAKYSLLDFLQLSFQALAFGCDVDFSFEDEVNIEAGRVARCAFADRRRFDEGNVVYIGKTLDRSAIVLNHSPDCRLMRKDFDSNLYPGFDFQLGAEIAHVDD